MSKKCIQIFSSDESVVITRNCSCFDLSVPSSAGSEWGMITGTLSDQTDLQSELNTKQNLISFGSDNQIPFVNSSGDDFDYSSNLTFNGTNLAIAGTTSRLIQFTSNSGAYNSPQLSLASFNTGITLISNDEVYVVSNNTGVAKFKYGGVGLRFFNVKSDVQIGWSSGLVNGSSDTTISRSGVGELTINGRVVSRVTLTSGTAASGTAPLNFNTGINLTSPENGAMEFDGTNLFFTRTGSLRENVLVGDTESGTYVSLVTDNAVRVNIDGVDYYLQLVTPS